MTTQHQQSVHSAGLVSARTNHAFFCTSPPKVLPVLFATRDVEQLTFMLFGLLYLFDRKIRVGSLGTAELILHVGQGSDLAKVAGIHLGMDAVGAPFRRPKHHFVEPVDKKSAGCCHKETPQQGWFVWVRSPAYGSRTVGCFSPNTNSTTQSSFLSQLKSDHVSPARSYTTGARHGACSAKTS
jgi:hypothetical protein